MKWEKLDENLVVLSKAFNPSTRGIPWLLKNAIVSEEEVRPGVVANEMMTGVQSEDFELLLVPGRLHIKPTCADDGRQTLLVRKVEAVSNALPGESYVACGLNFLWHLVAGDDPQGIPELTRQLFCRPESSFFQAFKRGNPRYGTYISCDALGCRLRFEAKPLIVVPIDPSIPKIELETIQFSFNFHLDLDGVANAPDQMLDLVRHWDEAKALTRELLGCLPEGVKP